MFGFSKKEIFMNTDLELFFRITAALKEHGIRYETKHVNGTTVVFRIDCKYGNLGSLTNP